MLNNCEADSKHLLEMTLHKIVKVMGAARERPGPDDFWQDANLIGSDYNNVEDGKPLSSQLALVLTQFI